MAEFTGCDDCRHSDKGMREFPCTVCIHNAIDKFEPKTNKDAVKEMTCEEMARFLAIGCVADIEGMEDVECIGDCTLCFLQWLQKEAKG